MTSSAVNITQSPKKILVIKICCLGDIIFLTPSLRALRARFPSAHITLLTSSWVCPVAEQIPFINDILIFDAPLQQKLNSKGVAESFRLVRKLRKEKYDVVICGHRKKLFSMLGYYSRIPVRIGFADSHSRYITHPVMFRFDRHEIGRYCDLVNVLGVNTADMRTEIKPRFKDTKQIDDFISKIKIQPDDCLVGIMAGGGQNPGTSMHIKRWGADHYKELCKRILTDPKMKILLLGDSSDNELNETIRSGAGASPKNMLNIAGRLSLEALPSLLQKLQIVI
jgi:heptosyltransferase-2